MQDLISYRKGADTSSAYFNKIEKMIDKVMAHKWNKGELMSYFLTHCVEDIDVKTQIYMQDAKSLESIKTIIEKMENVKK